MTVLFSAGYTVPGGDEPLRNARILHTGNWRDDGTMAATNTFAGYSADAVMNTLTYERWKSSSTATASLTQTFTATRVITCACIAGHNLAGGTIRALYWDGAAFVGATSPLTVPDNSPIMMIFPQVSTTQMRITMTMNGTEAEVAVVKFGKPLQLPISLYAGHTPIDYGRQTTLRSTYSETGEFLGRTKQRSQLATSFDWTLLPLAWMQANWTEFQDAVEAEPFFIAWRPSDTQFVGYCQTDQVPIPQNMGVRDYMSVKMSVRGLAHGL